MNPDETAVIPTEMEDITVPLEGAADPIDALEDIDELRNLAKANRSIAQRYKAKLQQTPKPQPLTPKPENKIDEEIVNDVRFLKLSEKKRQFGHENSLSPEETDKLFQYAGDKDPSEALKDSFFQAGLKEFRNAKKVAGAIPSGSNRSTTVDGKSFKDMTPDERARNWSAIIKK